MSENRRNFALREENGEEDSVFSGRSPRQAAVKAARRVAETADSEDDAERVAVRLREHGTDKVHVYEGWSWVEEADESAPDFLGDEVTQANVSKEGIEHLE